MKSEDLEFHIKYELRYFNNLFDSFNNFVKNSQSILNKIVISNKSKFIPLFALYNKIRILETNEYVSVLNMNMSTETIYQKTTDKLIKAFIDRKFYQFQSIDNLIVGKYVIMEQIITNDLINERFKKTLIHLTIASMVNDPRKISDLVLLVKKGYIEKMVPAHRLIKRLSKIMNVIYVDSINELVFYNHSNKNYLLDNETLLNEHEKKIYNDVISNLTLIKQRNAF
jgi:hypothetical protein